jgi:hypothetical protein
MPVADRQPQMEDRVELGMILQDLQDAERQVVPGGVREQHRPAVSAERCRIIVAKDLHRRMLAPDLVRPKSLGYAPWPEAT